MKMKAKEHETGLTVDEVREILHYDPETGLFSSKICRSCLNVGKRSGYLRKDGYIQLKIKSRAFLAHRLAWFYVHGEWPNRDIDHVNRDKADNRIANLRLSTRSENCVNIGLKSSNTSGTTGVYFQKKKRIWQSYITKNRKRISTGGSKHKEKAIANRKNAEVHLFGEFAPK